MKVHKRGGRPSRKPKAGERVPLGLRVTPDVKLMLDHAAAVSGRSQSQEAELRLEQSFDRLGGPRTAAVLKSLAGLAELETGDRHWLDDHATFNAVVNSWMRVLERLAPPIPDVIKNQIENVNKTIHRIRDVHDPELRQRLVTFVELFADMPTLSANVRADLTAALNDARVNTPTKRAKET
jgi:hypothetical protein